MHRKDWDTVKQNQSHDSLGDLHKNAMAIHAQGRQTQQPGMCYGDNIRLVKKEIGDGGYRRWKGNWSKEHKREEKEHRLQTSKHLINAKISLLVKGWGVSFACIPTQSIHVGLQCNFTSLLTFIPLYN